MRFFILWNDYGYLWILLHTLIIVTNNGHFFVILIQEFFKSYIRWSGSVQPQSTLYDFNTDLNLNASSQLK